MIPRSVDGHAVLLPWPSVLYFIVIRLRRIVLSNEFVLFLFRFVVVQENCAYILLVMLSILCANFRLPQVQGPFGCPVTLSG